MATVRLVDALAGASRGTRLSTYDGQRCIICYAAYRTNGTVTHKHGCPSGVRG